VFESVGATVPKKAQFNGNISKNGKHNQKWWYTWKKGHTAKNKIVGDI